MDNNAKTEMTASFRTGYVAIIGEPNVGKSTLMNRIIGRNLSAVTKKPQTTRHKIIGIMSTDQVQIIFMDTPGLIEPKYLLHEAMMRMADGALIDADVAVLITDATMSINMEVSQKHIAVERIKKSKIPVFLALNKTDLVPANKIDPILDGYRELFPFRGLFPISALNGAGIPELLGSITNDLPVHPPFYPPELISDNPEKFFVSEIIRQKIFELYQEEIPYSTAVDILEYSEREGRKDLIRADIYIERDSQKGILIGKNGKAIKEIGEKARIDIEEFLGRQVFLELFVKVRANWRNDRQWLRRFGYLS